MSIYCYFNKEYEKTYTCSYEINEEGICVVKIEYELADELKSTDNITIFGKDISFQRRDITIVDSKSKKTFLLKDAYNVGYSTIFGGEYRHPSCQFESPYHFSSESVQKVDNLVAASAA